MHCADFLQLINVHRFVVRLHSYHKPSKIIFTISVEPLLQSLLVSSNILNGDVNLGNQLAAWLKDKTFGFELCYRASRDGWGGKDFHGKCDSVGPTVTLLKCGTNVFGGYTDQNWKSDQQARSIRRKLTLKRTQGISSAFLCVSLCLFVLCPHDR